jgi:hypothetical protein
MENKKDVILSIEYFGRNNEQVNEIPGLIGKLREFIEKVMAELKYELENLR